MTYGVALAITLAVEVPLVVAWARASAEPLPVKIGVCAGANLLTHGTLWTFFWELPFGYWGNLVVAESLVFLTEGALFTAFALFPWRKAVAVSFVANVITTAIGLVLSA